MKALITLLLFSLSLHAQSEKPNILWIISEDNGCYLGCYGDQNAKTPNLDQLAAKGIRYTNCFANAPVCAPARCTLLLGTHASTTGTFHMRSSYKVPQEITPFHHPLKDAGYFVTGSKGDYNNATYHQKDLWDGHAGKEDHYKKRDASQPFFAVYNIGHSHESRIFNPHPVSGNAGASPIEFQHPIDIPPYMTDTEVTRTDLARMYTSVQNMDQRVGSIFRRLEKNGEADNTIVFYISDHGGIMIRSKRYLYDSGARIPYIAYYPEKWKHLAPEGYKPGAMSKRLVDFTDIIKTLLSHCGANIPEHYAGRVLAGKESESPQDYALLFSGRFDETQDLSRGITNGRYKFIRNYEPDRRAHQLLHYPLQQDAQLAHFKAYQAGNTNKLQSSVFEPHAPVEFYDTHSDPHEVNNLIDSPDHQTLITQFSEALDQKILKTHDLGFIPEPTIEKVDKSQSTIYNWARQGGNYPLEEIIPIANMASSQNPKNIPLLQQKLTHSNPIVRYWAALGLRVLGKSATPAKESLKKATEDPDYCVRIISRMALGNIDPPKEHALAALADGMLQEHDIATSWALGVAKYLEFTKVSDYYSDKDLVRGSYSKRSYEDLKTGKTYTRLVQ